ncbi:lysylphosphatidylglycerol synthase domain-containing protein [Calothrix sp. 336/3]|uniref:lysylphosphatidylglycerol synthase domain-containing protein n=1 Tax=Calothrix sp. 336/3 TaxID=1337936 RepID=UPI0004E3A34B|nr:lysylphosphatidylglycerol synthase domain-containing protein [Calothrix sp. 336/3]AKG23740.1 integral membrane protein [Calothrix sp. 336/3]
MKQSLRWLILGGTLFFLATAVKQHWQEVAAIRIDILGWVILIIATGVTLLAHTWAGWVWTWVLKELNQSVNTPEFIQVYLKTNIAKYVPGNIWHHYGRIVAARNANISIGIATISVLIEPLLMAAAALILVILLGNNLTHLNNSILTRILQITGLIVILGVIHPRFFNPIISWLQSWKSRKSVNQNIETVSLGRYPLIPLVGELAFILLRSIGFILTFTALTPIKISDIPILLGAFSFSWLLGFIVPGAPGGLGVFEATAIALLQNHFSAGIIISATGLYRLVSILSESLGASVAWLDARLFSTN